MDVISFRRPQYYVLYITLSLGKQRINKECENLKIATKSPLFLPSMLRLWVVLRTEVLVFRAQVYWPPSLLLIGQHWLSVHQSQLTRPLWTNQRPALRLCQPIPAHLSPRTVSVTPWPPGAEATPSLESCSTLKVSAEIT